MSGIMLEECFFGMAPEITSRCDCDGPNDQLSRDYDLPGENDQTRSVTVTCPYCEEQETFTYELQDDGSWCMID